MSGPNWTTALELGTMRAEPRTSLKTLSARLADAENARKTVLDKTVRGRGELWRVKLGPRHLPVLRQH